MPYELWTGHKPDLGNLKPWCSAAYIHDLSHKYGKLGLRGKKSIFIRYSKHSKGHVFIGENESGNVIEFESRDATFLENEFPRRGDVNQDLSLFKMEDQNDLFIPSQVGDIRENVSRSPNPSRNDNDESSLVPPDHQPQRSNRSQLPRRHFDIDGEALMTILQGNDEPNTIEKVLSSLNKDKWRNALEEEMESMKENQVWKLVELPKDTKPLGTNGLS